MIGEKEIIFESPPSRPDDEFWLEQGRELVKGSITAVLDAAKSLLTGLGLLQGIYLGIIGFADYIPKTMPLHWKSLFLLPLISWLVALSFCLWVVMTKRFEFHPRSPDEIRETYEKILEEKQRFLKAAFVFMALGIILAMLLFIFRYQL